MKFQLICSNEYRGSSYDVVSDILSEVSLYDIQEIRNKAYVEIEDLEELEDFIGSLDFYKCEYVAKSQNEYGSTPVLMIK